MDARSKRDDATREALQEAADKARAEVMAEFKAAVEYALPKDERTLKEIERLLRRAVEKGFREALYAFQQPVYNPGQFFEK